MNLHRSTLGFLFALGAASSFAIPEGVFVLDSINQSPFNPQGARAARFDQQMNFLGNSIGPGEASFQTPQVIAEAPDGTFLISDQLADTVHQYSEAGVYLGSWPTTIDNIRGITRGPDGLYYVANGSTNQIEKYTASGVFAGVFASVVKPWYVLFRRGGDVLVSSSRTTNESPVIERFSASGVPLGPWVSNYPFTQQMHELADGNVLVSVFSMSPAIGITSGLHEFSADGVFVRRYSIDGTRGCTELADGSLLATGGTRLVRFTRGNSVGTDIDNFGGTLSSNFRLLYNTNFPTLVRGTVSLQDFNGDPATVSMAYELRNSGGTVVQSGTTTLDSTGRYSFVTTQRGNLKIWLKPSHWLAASVSATINQWGAQFSPSVINGDVDGDNSVTIFDYIDLSSSFDLNNGDAGYIPGADLDGDDSVTIFDYIVLSNNFDVSGAE